MSFSQQLPNPLLEGRNRNATSDDDVEGFPPLNLGWFVCGNLHSFRVLQVGEIWKILSRLVEEAFWEFFLEETGVFFCVFLLGGGRLLIISFLSC